MSTLDWSHLSLLIAFVFYVFALIVGVSTYASTRPFLPRLAQGVLGVGWVLHTCGLGLRWFAAGFSHPPMTNIYETLLFFVWGLLLVVLYIEIRHQIHVQSPPAILVAIVGMGLASLQPNKGIEPLVPALQSLWLHIHVAFAGFSYGFFLLSAIFSFLYLLKHRKKVTLVGNILSVFSIFSLIVVGGWSTFLLEDVSFNRVLKVEGRLRTTGETIPLEYASSLICALVLLQVVYLLSQLILKKKYTQSSRAQSVWYAQKGRMGVCVFSLLLYTGLLAWVFWILTHTQGLALASNPYRLVILVLGFVSTSLQLGLHLGYEKFREVLPDEEMLEQLSYKAVLIALPFLTIVISTGSVWAHYAWGRYWGWDPKETWSLITWLIYALYLHLRLQKRWQGQRLALLSIAGFFAVIFTYLGVNFLLSGLHSYG